MTKLEFMVRAFTLQHDARAIEAKLKEKNGW